MNPRAIWRVRWRHALLFTLTGWAALLSLEALVRLPGAVGGLRLPAQLSRQGMRFQRGPAAAPVAALPDGLELLEAADYAADSVPVQGSPFRTAPIRLRLLALTSSGTGVHLPVEDLGSLLLGPGGRGRCVVLDEAGAVVREMPTAEDWQAMAASTAPDLAGTISWLAGLRPYRPNLCVWESLP